MRVYVAYRYSMPNTILDHLGNIGRAIEIGKELAKFQGVYPYIPHLDCLLAMSDTKQEIPLTYYYTNSLEWLKVCDIMYLVEPEDISKLRSKGVSAEYKYCRDNGIPIISGMVNFSFINEMMKEYDIEVVKKIHPSAFECKELDDIVKTVDSKECYDNRRVK